MEKARLPDRLRFILPTLALAALSALPAPRAAAQAVDNEKRAEQAAKQAEFDSITRAITVTEDRQAALRAEIAVLTKDRTTLNRTLIAAGKRSKQLERQIGETEGRIAKLRGREEELRTRLSGQRAVLAEVLAALQRMGRRPPPAILVRPQDALTSVRSAILLGAVVPDLRAKAEAISANLSDLVSVKGRLDSERARLKADATQLVEERQRIALLIEERKKAQSASQKELKEERLNANELARKAGNLKELIDRLEREIAGAAGAARRRTGCG